MSMLSRGPSSREEGSRDIYRPEALAEYCGTRRDHAEARTEPRVRPAVLAIVLALLALAGAAVLVRVEVAAQVRYELDTNADRVVVHGPASLRSASDAVLGPGNPWSIRLAATGETEQTSSCKPAPGEVSSEFRTTTTASLSAADHGRGCSTATLRHTVPLWRAVVGTV